MLPKTNAVFVPNTKEPKDFTEEDVRGMTSNPIYTGIGPFPQIIPDELWISTAIKQINEQGAIQFLVNMLYVLRESFRDINNATIPDE